MSATAFGDCFIVAYRLVRDDDDLILCHGIVADVDNVIGPHWHAWVEQERTFEHEQLSHPVVVRTCIDRSNGNDMELPAEMYYKVGRVERETVLRYTHDEAALLALTHEQYGPWEEQR
jgi:hypothetical protein